MQDGSGHLCEGCGTDDHQRALDVTTKGVFVRFADEREGLIPLGERKFASKPQKIRLFSPSVLEVLLRDGSWEELPWDYVRAFIDPHYRARAEEEGRRGWRLLGERLKRLRSQKGLSQEELAARSQVSRVTIAAGGRGAGPAV